MDLLQLQYFETLAELQNVTHAANALHVAQPALSRSLKGLEQELGLQLFHRIGKHIYLNENGKILLAHTKRIMQELADARMALEERKDLSNQQVNISMQAGTKLLPDLIRGFQARHPEIMLKINQQSGGFLAEKCDIVIDSSMHPQNSPNTAALMEEEIYLAMPVTNPLSKRASVPLLEVAQEPFIGLYKGKALRTITDEYCNMAGFVPRIILESDNPATVRELIALGMGLAFVPKITWKGIDQDPNVILVPIECPHCIRYVNMTWRANRYVSKASLALRAYLVEFFEQAARG